MVAEKRVRLRRPMEQRCWLALEPSQPLVECSLKDVSQTGARFILATEGKIPSKFDLYLTLNGSVGRNCEVVWQSGKEIGIKFLGRAVPYRRTEKDGEVPLGVEA